MLGRVAVTAANGRGHHHRQLDVAARHISVLGQMVVDLVHAHAKKVDKHQLHNGPQARRRRPGGGTNKRGLRDRRVHDAVWAKLVEQATRGAKNTAIGANVLAHDKDIGVARHLLGNAFR